MARHDALTGLGNRFLLQESLERAVAGLQSGKPFAVLVLDLDHFKEANDSLGHTVGDTLLREVAARLRSCVFGSDTVVRTGGDEFAIVQTAITGPEEAGDLATAILAALAEPFIIDDHQIEIGASIGIACAPRDEAVGTLLLRLADIALYRAKAEGRRAYRFFEASMDAVVQARRQLAKDLRVALVREEFELYFQPINSAKTNSIKSFEALIRWHHPVRGMVSPDEFIRLAEETDLIVPLGEWVLKAACREATQWPSDIGVAVNISASQFIAGDLTKKIRGALAEAKLSADRLEVEITESTLLDRNTENLAILHELRAMGIKIAMDDFGTGYSSLSYLRSFPFDKIKIDQSFVKNIAERDAREIVRAIANLGQTLGIATTAEGVETHQQLQSIIAYGCTEVQGYLFSPPVPACQVSRLVEKFHQHRRVA
jgi:diguanylate cyclase (GGDEF)-like protein